MYMSKKLLAIKETPDIFCKLNEIYCNNYGNEIIMQNNERFECLVKVRQSYFYIPIYVNKVGEYTIKLKARNESDNVDFLNISRYFYKGNTSTTYPTLSIGYTYTGYQIVRFNATETGTYLFAIRFLAEISSEKLCSISDVKAEKANASYIDDIINEE